MNTKAKQTYPDIEFLTKRAEAQWNEAQEQGEVNEETIHPHLFDMARIGKKRDKGKELQTAGLHDTQKLVRTVRKDFYHGDTSKIPKTQLMGIPKAEIDKILNL